ncbi:FtsX-like permease family protein [Haliscomenobacter sp.]|uniref:ABC transporter permease n=1 Tax=Haliscomenobacter sp. TaxID=2717303 RepID=UPI003593A8B9
MVLSQTTAEKYFGKSNSYLGKTLDNTRGETWKITGVMQDIPQNSHIHFDALMADHEIRQIAAADGGNWGQFAAYNYVLLHPKVDPQTFETKIRGMYDKYMASIFKPLKININYVVQPITSIRLHSVMTQEPEPLGSLAYVRILGITAIFLVLLACINYINLTTARATRRAREVGVRKALGSTRGSLATQFLAESALLVLISGGVGLGLATSLLPIFNTMAGKLLTTSALFQPTIMIGLASILVLAGLIAGSYPALVLSGFQAVDVLKGDQIRSSGGWLRRALVVTQFAASLMMLIATGVIYDQLQFLKNKDLGFQKNQVLVLRPDPGSTRRSEVAAFRDMLKQNAALSAVATSSVTPGIDVTYKNVVTIEGNEGMKEVGIDVAGADQFFFPTLGIEVVKGKNFSGQLSDTLNAVVINEALVKKMGWADPIGKKVRTSGGNDAPFAQVIGVVKDYHQKSLYNPIEPLIFVYRQASFVVHSRVKPDNLPATLKSVEANWKAAFPAQEFKYTFLDDEFNQQFIADQKRGTLFSVFSGLSIFIACLGLLGLVAYTTEQRRREIGIRKVLGAGQGQVVTLLARHFIILVLVAGVIAMPLAAWFLTGWLKEFPYHTTLQPLTFIAALLSLLALTMVTVSFHTIRAALANPVKSLRSE